MTNAPQSWRSLRWITGEPPAIAQALWSALACLLLLCFALYLNYAWQAIWFPFGLDYGEGEIWQQAAMIPGRLMYGNINHPPFIGFEYPPLYHLLTRLFTWRLENFLPAGRFVSVASASVVAASVASLVTLGSSAESPNTVRRAAMIAALLPFTLHPLLQFSAWARVDLLAIAFSVGGVAIAARAAAAGAALSCFSAFCGRGLYQTNRIGCPRWPPH